MVFGDAVVAAHAGEARPARSRPRVDADNEHPLANADVAISWTDLSFDRKTLHANAEQHDSWVRTGPRGEYRICNVPIGSWLLIQLQYAGHAGNAVRVSVSGEEAVVVRNLSLSVAEAPTLTRSTPSGATVRGLDSEPTADDSTRRRAVPHGHGVGERRRPRRRSGRRSTTSRSASSTRARRPAPTPTDGSR